MFHVVEEASVVVRKGGLFKQAKVFRRDGGVYASYGGGFIRLSSTGTSIPLVSWEQLVLRGDQRPPSYDRLGRMTDDFLH